MKQTLITTGLSSLFLLAVAGGACGTIPPAAGGGDDPGSSAGMPPTVATLASELESLCDLRSSCSAAAPLSAEERAECLDQLRAAAGAPCASEAVAFGRCGVRHQVCTAAGEIDDEATSSALETACEAELAAMSVCCEREPATALCASDPSEPDAPEAEPAPAPAE